MNAGAGGNWTRFDECLDETVVKQSDLSCVSADGEMLMRDRGIVISQQEIRDIIGSPAHFESLAKCLNKFDRSEDGRIWRAFATDETSLIKLLNIQPVGVILIEALSMGHAVLIEKMESRNIFKIKDPFEQTRYSMNQRGFRSCWSGVVIART